MEAKTKQNIVWVDENDLVVGSGDVYLTHLNPAKLHRAISVFLFRKTSAGRVELLCQKRSQKKVVGAGRWANTVCGNVWPDEEYLDCAKRRLKNEIGVEGIKIEPLIKFRYQVACDEKYSENEIDQFFVGFIDKPAEFSCKLNLDEVAEVSWLDWQTLLEAFSQRKQAEFSGGIIKMQLDDKTQDLVLTPWFGIFLSDKDVMGKIEGFLDKNATK